MPHGPYTRRTTDPALSTSVVRASTINELQVGLEDSPTIAEVPSLVNAALSPAITPFNAVTRVIAPEWSAT